MGAGASIEEEIQRPADASDVATPRGESAKREVVRLRALVQAQRAAEAAATGVGAATVTVVAGAAGVATCT